MKHSISKAIFPIAGLGTRFLPATKSVPKEMLTILDRPIIEWAVIEAAKSGINEMIFVTSSRKNIVLEHFEKSEIRSNCNNYAGCKQLHKEKTKKNCFC